MKRTKRIATTAVLGCTIIAGSIMPAFAQTQAAALPQTTEAAIATGVAISTSAALQTTEAATKAAIQTDKALIEKFNAALAKGNTSEALLIMSTSFGKHSVADNTAMIESYTAWLENHENGINQSFTNLYEKYSLKAKKDVFMANKLQLKDINDPVVMAKSGTLKAQKDLKELIRKALIMGYRVNTSEGMYFFSVDYQRFASLGTAMNSDLLDYLSIMGKQSNKPAISDGSPAIPLDELAARIAQMEQFAANHPDSKFNASLKMMHREFMGDYLFAYTYDYDSKKLNKESLASYNKTVKAYPTLLIGDIVKQYLSLVDKNKGQVTDKVLQDMNKVMDEKIAKLG